MFKDQSEGTRHQGAPFHPEFDIDLEHENLPFQALPCRWMLYGPWCYVVLVQVDDTSVSDQVQEIHLDCNSFLRCQEKLPACSHTCGAPDGDLEQIE